MEEKQVGIINIRDFIGDCNDFMGIFLIDIIKQVKAYPLATSFKVFIDSKGGDVNEAFKIYDYLVSLSEKGIRIITIGEKTVASSATIIHQAGDEGFRFLMTDCVFMIHLPSGYASGTSEDIGSYFSMMQEVDKVMCQFYESKFDIPKEFINQMLKSETYFQAKDCEELGIASIYNEMPIVARAK